MGITRDQGKLKIDGGNNERKTIRTIQLPLKMVDFKGPLGT